MLAKIVSSYLLGKGVISKEQNDSLFKELSRARAKLGLIAVHEGYLTEVQANTINVLQASMDKRFGDIAVEKGFLTDAQVGELLAKQGEPYLALAQAFENLKIMDINDLNSALEDFIKEKNLPASALEDLKSDDIDRIVPLFVPEGQDEYLEIAKLAVKTIMRCVENNVAVDKACITSSLDIDNVSVQHVEADKSLTTLFAGRADALLYMASVFGQEEFGSVDEDALDAVAELINCINGMYASSMSEKGISMELLPPELYAEAKTVTGKGFMVMPLYIKDDTVYLIFSIGDKPELR